MAFSQYKRPLKPQRNMRLVIDHLVEIAPASNLDQAPDAQI